MGASSIVQTKFLQLGICVTFCLVIFSALTRFILDTNDRTRCESMLNDGTWLDDDFRQWQPSGCMMHTYKADEVASCLNHSHILYIGDSIARQQFFSFAKLIHPDIDTEGEKHTDRKYEFKNESLTFEFWWDPYLNNTRTLQFFQQPTSSDLRPSLLVVGTGSWYMRYLDATDYMDNWKTAIQQVIHSVARSQVADAVILSPVEIPQFDRLSSDRSTTITQEKVLAMNDYLTAQLSALENTLTPFAIPFAWNKIITSSNNVTQDGLHYDSMITTTQVQLALNYRCNDVRPKHFPYNTTCCFHYPAPRWYQNLFFILFLVLVPIGFYLHGTNLQQWIPSEKILNALFIFGLGVIYMYFGDRTQLFSKMHKHYDSSIFTMLMVLTVVLAGLITLKTNKKEGVDLGFLNRDQTDEWKGWMQVIILIYHFVGASGTSGIYNAVRILVAAYLFQTGYGHFFFFYKKSDFGLARVLNVMVRLNFLTFVLQYLMDTDYLSYYFTPLVSFWFGVIYLTMYIGHGNNHNLKFIVAKLALAALITTTFIKTPGVLEFVFDLLRSLFNIQWDAREWRFRLSLDGYIVYVGMISALVYIKFMELKLMDHPSFGQVKLGTLVVSCCALVWYFYYELTRQDKLVYNLAQPYISWIPILAFVFLRNATVQLRNTSSRFFIFIGKISLETFIGQFHMWLAGDTKGLLVVIPQQWVVSSSSLGWYINLTISTVLFVFVCYYLSQATGEITRWICSELLLDQSHGTPSRGYQAVPLLPTSLSSLSSAAAAAAASPATAATTSIATAATGATVVTSTSSMNEHEHGKGIDNNTNQAIPVEEVGDNDDDIPTTRPPSLGYRILHHAGFKVTVFLLGIGILNRIS